MTNVPDLASVLFVLVGLLSIGIAITLVAGSIVVSLVVAWLTDIEFPVVVTGVISMLTTVTSVLGLIWLHLTTSGIAVKLVGIFVAAVLVCCLLTLVPIAVGGWISTRLHEDLTLGRGTHVVACGWLVGLGGHFALSSVVAPIASVSPTVETVAVGLWILSLLLVPVGMAVAARYADRIAATIDQTSPHWGRPLLSIRVR
ncbi:hypothetical protein [Halococcoides cellulosivorans]|uniref:Uncharacterized protein n=1 Tax=Halococcoides cellulosivorans TaxID=1679096 RepID=A0A2R4X3C1_9EURY|nr:hypothetical protein [Halococcoides cellulosivorans]AWB28295.1 hypothetical protein HARCEL1_11555 [Halococcoides cellulosivorans]